MNWFKKAQSIGGLIDKQFFIEPLRKYIQSRFFRDYFNPAQKKLFNFNPNELVEPIMQKVLSISIGIEFTEDLKEKPIGVFHFSRGNLSIEINGVNYDRYVKDRYKAGYFNYVNGVIFHELTHAVDYIQKVFEKVSYNEFDEENYYNDVAEQRAYYAMMKDFLEDFLVIKPYLVQKMMNKYTTDAWSGRSNKMKEIREMGHA